MKGLTKYARAATVSVAALLLAAPASAAEADKNPSNAPAVMEQPQSGAVEQPKVADKAMTDATAGTPIALGQAVWSSDGTDLGPITKVNLGPNGAVESIQFTVGSMLGIGGKTVVAKATDFTQIGERIELKLDAASANSLPEVKA